jgi:hypothetical protein
MFKDFKEHFENNTEEILDFTIGRCDYSKEQIRLMLQMLKDSKNTSVIGIILEESRVDDDMLPDLIDLPETVKRLNLRLTYITEKSFENFQQLEHIQNLFLDPVFAEGYSWVKIRDLFKMPSLKNLSVTVEDLNAISLKDIPEGLRVEVNGITLTHCDDEDKGKELLEIVKRNK